MAIIELGVLIRALSTPTYGVSAEKPIAVYSAVSGHITF
jgi:hypothetical protein